MMSWLSVCAVQYITWCLEPCVEGQRLGLGTDFVQDVHSLGTLFFCLMNTIDSFHLVETYAAHTNT